MARVRTRTLTFPTRLRRTLTDGLMEAGINARIRIEAVRTTNLYRVMILADQFNQLRPAERQDLVWRIVDQAFSPAEQLRISMIMTLSPDEV